MRSSSGDLAQAHALARLLPPDQLPALLDRLAQEAGALAFVVYLASYAQDVLTPVPGHAGPARSPQAVEGTLAGRCYQTLEVQVAHQEEDGTRLWVPVVDGVARVGVAEVVLPADVSVAPATLAAWSAFVDVVAPLVLTKNIYGDAFTLARRARPLTLAAEVQWGMLPPLTFGTDEVLVAAALEPAYEIGGDTFDYAVNSDTVHVAVFDAMGHGLRASLLASLALATYRNARRQGLGLVETAQRIDAVVGAEHAGDRFVTGALAQLDIPSGRLARVSCGHPDPLLLRQGRLVRRDPMPPSLPLGLAGVLGQPFEPEVDVETLEPGDRVVLYTDGVVESRSPAGEEFGVDQLVEAVTRETSSGRTLPEVLRRLVRRLLEHSPELQDDASLLVVQWGGDAGASLLPSPRPHVGH